MTHNNMCHCDNIRIVILIKNVNMVAYEKTNIPGCMLSLGRPGLLLLSAKGHSTHVPKSSPSLYLLSKGCCVCVTALHLWLCLTKGPLEYSRDTCSRRSQVVVLSCLFPVLWAVDKCTENVSSIQTRHSTPDNVHCAVNTQLAVSEQIILKRPLADCYSR